MNPISSSKARAEFFSLIDTVNQSHEPALNTGTVSYTHLTLPTILLV